MLDKIKEFLRQVLQMELLQKIKEYMQLAVEYIGKGIGYIQDFIDWLYGAVTGLFRR